MERAKPRGLTNSIGEVIAVDAATDTPAGSTKAIEVTSERSES